LWAGGPLGEDFRLIGGNDDLLQRAIVEADSAFIPFSQWSHSLQHDRFREVAR
jgi:hypothetical protein